MQLEIITCFSYDKRMAITFESDNWIESAWKNPLEALVAVNVSLNGTDNRDSCLRIINFMSYELTTLCDNKSDFVAFQILNDFFFNTKGFRLSKNPLLLKNILDARSGCGIALSLLYIHLAQGLGLQLHLIHWPFHAILKWEHEGKAHFIDLEHRGQTLSEDDLLLIVNRHKEQVRILSLKEALVQYLAYISLHYRRAEEHEALHKTLNLILRLEPENTRFLAERALLRKDLGLVKESLCDFKRYFAFTDKAAASPEVLAVYETVRSLT